MGRLGKPQKSKKHKKVKAVDPFYTGNRAADRHAGKFNQPVRGSGQDDMPNSVKEIMALHKDINNLKSKRKKKNKFQQEDRKEFVEQMEKGMTRPVKPVPRFTQNKGEDDVAFINRIERHTQNVIAKAQYEDKYKVDLDKVENGETTAKKTKKKKTKAKERIKKLQEKQVVKKGDKIQKNFTGFEHLQDNVKFGEVAMEPPSFSAKPRKSQNIESKTAGSKSLLLKDMLDKKSEKTKTLSAAAQTRQIGQTVKRKLLPPAQQVMMDAEREKAIQRYRLMKAKKMAAKSLQ